MMRPFTLAELCGPLAGQLLGDDARFSAVSTDSRKALDGQLFVALAGERFDGHDYLSVARDGGAAGALVSRRVDAALPLLLVDDTQRALGQLGACNRALFTKPLVAITGSSGKTTVKNLVNAVLSQRGNTLATEGNLNNEIGVPLTLLRLAPEHEFAVVEMGAAKAGDIAWLCELGKPDVAVLLNAMPAHLQGFGSVDEVAQAKGEIYDGLGGSGTAVINADSEYAGRWRKRAGSATVLDYGLQKSAAISANNISSRGTAGISFIASTPAGDVPVALRLPGLHNVSNALAAIAVGLACELSLTEITAGLASVQPVPGRLAISRGRGGCTLIDDCYNANPGSVRAAIDLLADCEGRRTLLLGAMRELGAESEALHRQMGDYARQRGIDGFWGVGEELAPAVAAFGKGGRHFDDRAGAAAALANAFGSDDTVLVKGSRGAAMELLLAELQEQNGEASR
ncbi:UDP-N-acetylmuramoyl-tripeptide--D-alanyl-D-alanine ligase [Parahaliea mediterranea]|uniref:UDP-N-acetylmuramoyl-tripeptide--D-alanyl-D- alanine ligase n=1 Tax=Parahaliea mediterranea TaxID=651086 RepID=UPI000E2F48ED|nr:UDP-N-acetylmuramoyl-tripeptide--D-alanyl-D-alanine ligase [Parahaliea mediterranea]